MCVLLYSPDGSLVPRKTNCIARSVASNSFGVAFHFLPSHNRFGVAEGLLRLLVLIASASCYWHIAIA